MLISEGDARNAYGIHTVRISKYGGCSETCLPWQGRVYVDDVYSGGTKEEAQEKKLPLLSEAIEGGLFHPNCKHIATTYFYDLEESLDKIEKEGVENPLEEQEHRKNMLHIQQQKRLEVGSLDPDNIRQAQIRKEQWEKKDEFIRLNTDSTTNIQYMAKFGEDSRIKLSSTSELFHIKKVENSEFDLWCDYTTSAKAGSINLTLSNLRKVKEIIGEENLPRIIITQFTKAKGFSSSAVAGYNKSLDTIFLNAKFSKEQDILNTLENGYFSTKNVLHPYLHEFGHKKYYELVEKLSKMEYNTFSKGLKEYLGIRETLLFDISRYAYGSFTRDEYGEVYAEYYAKKMLTNEKDVVTQFIDSLERRVDDYDDYTNKKRNRNR